MKRRSFVKTISVLSAVGAVAPRLFAAERSTARYRAAIIGHTGHGDYGHGLDVVFNDHPRIEVVALADADDAGRKKAVAKVGVPRDYADYRAMLEKEKPQLVSVAPRWTDQHLPMTRAALESGAHVFSEKPFAQMLADADELLALAKKKDLKIAVAHQMRLAPSIVHLKSVLDSGKLGDLVEIKAYGKQDARAGGEDMLVLGTHLFDLIRLFAGDPQWCFARVLSKGHEITRADARKPTEAIGSVAGDDVQAQFGFANGMVATFTSTAKLRQTVGHWGLQLFCSNGIVRILADVYPRVLMSKPGSSNLTEQSDPWTTLEGDPWTNASAADRSFGPANRRLLDDLLAAIEDRREPVCSGYNGAKAIEMVMAVYESALARARVPLPLKNRKHPLDR